MHKDDLGLLQQLTGPRAGIVTRQQLLRWGFDAELPSREVNAGRWRRLLPGVYLLGGGTPSFEQRCHASVLHAGRRAVITGLAGWALQGGMEVDRVWGVLVLVPQATRKVSRDFCALRRTHHLPAAVQVTSAGRHPLPVAPAWLCVADAIRSARDLADGRAVACRAARDTTFDWTGLERAAARSGPGAGQLGRIVKDLLDGVRSPAEGELHDALRPAARKGQLPPYLLNPELYVDGVLIGSPDVYFPGLGLGDEMDSREWHEDTGLLDATLLRHDRFTRYGLRLNHTTPARFRASPADHVARLRVLAAERRTLDAPEPPGLVVLARGPLHPTGRAWPTSVPDHHLGLGSFRRQAAA